MKSKNFPKKGAEIFLDTSLKFCLKIVFMKRLKTFFHIYAYILKTMRNIKNWRKNFL